MRIGSCSLLLATLVLTACPGCDSESQGQFIGSTVPVRGMVLYKGKPLTQGEILFEPDSGGREAHGNIQTDGTFELTTYKAGDGAVPGTHRVAVSGTSKKDAVPLRYKNPSSSRTEVEVGEGKGEYTIDF